MKKEVIMVALTIKGPEQVRTYDQIFSDETLELYNLYWVFDMMNRSYVTCSYYYTVIDTCVESVLTRLEMENISVIVVDMMKAAGASLSSDSDYDSVIAVSGSTEYKDIAKFFGDYNEGKIDESHWLYIVNNASKIVLNQNEKG